MTSTNRTNNSKTGQRYEHFLKYSLGQMLKFSGAQPKEILATDKAFHLVMRKKGRFVLVDLFGFWLEQNLILRLNIT